MKSSNLQVALYVTCLINTQRPKIAWDTVSLIESLGFTVEVPPTQTCCGQPSYNNGHCVIEAAKLQIKTLEPFDMIVVPSGSCAGMIKNHYPSVLNASKEWRSRSKSLAKKTFELSDFLLQQKWTPNPSIAQNNKAHSIAHHTSCSCRRDTQTHHCADELLQRNGNQLKQFEEQEVCCGFGGTFSEKFSALSERMAQNKLDAIEAENTNTVVSADLGCLLHLEHINKKLKRPFKFLHLAEILRNGNG